MQNIEVQDSILEYHHQTFLYLRKKKSFHRGHDYLPVTHCSYSLSVDNEKKNLWLTG